MYSYVLKIYNKIIDYNQPQLPFPIKVLPLSQAPYTNNHLNYFVCQKNAR